MQRRRSKTSNLNQPVTISSLAKYLKLSPAAVSMVLNSTPKAARFPEKTRKRILAAAAKFNYRPNFVARSLRKQQTFTIGVLVPEVSEGYAALVLAGIEDYLLQAGYFYFVVSHRHKTHRLEQYPRLFMERLVEGIIAVDTTDLPFIAHVPTAVVSGHRRMPGITNVVLDHRHAALLALEHLLTARNAMDQQMVIIDWYWRMQLQSGLTELWLAKKDLELARSEAERFLEVTLATAERTWQALAWEANARVAMAQLDTSRARECVTSALSTMEGFEVPLAAWRVHATAAELYGGGESSEAAEHHRELSRATILKLADSLPAEEPLRKTFLSAPSVRQVLGNGETTNGKRSRSPTKRVKRSAKKSAPT